MRVCSCLLVMLARTTVMQLSVSSIPWQPSASTVAFSYLLRHPDKQEAQLMLTTGSTRLAVSRGQQTWYGMVWYTRV